jgi:N-acyl-D-amino-acid deacylase
VTTFETIIRGGTVVDGTASEPVITDVGINGDSIAALGDLSSSNARTEIDANGLHVSPGFIDAHGHSDYTLLADGRAFSQVSQGVTTEVIGNCGHGCAPIVGDPEGFTGNIYGYTGNPELSWYTFGEYLDRLQAAGPAINAVPLVPHGNLRISSMADRSKPVTRAEAETMKRHMDEAFDEGAWGLSFGLEYGSERSASFDELSALSRLTAERDGLLAVHTRNKETLAVEAVNEAIQLGRAADSAVQVSHIIPRLGGSPDDLEKIINSINSSASTGMDIAFDIHTRLHGITHLSDALFPDMTQESADEIRQALDSESTRQALSKRECLISSFALGGWDRITVYTSPMQPDLAGRTIADLAAEWRLGDWDAVFKVLSINAEDIHGPLVICHSYEEADVISTALQDLCLIGSDATALCKDGPLAGETFLGAYSWAGWTFSRLTGDSGNLSVARAIRKLTGSAADRFGLADRGYVATGKKADIVVFNPGEFVEVADLNEPNRPCEGVRDVLVNGVLTLSNGRQISQSGGRVLRKGSAN